MKPITIETKINEPIEKIWEYWTNPEHVTKWCFASDDWCAPRASNDLRVGGTFTTRMESTDGKTGFDFGGTYTDVNEFNNITYVMEYGRKVNIEFIKQDDDRYIVRETFDPEDINTEELQRKGWQSILENFKKHVTSK